MEKSQEQIVQDITKFITWLHPTGTFEMRLLTSDKGMRPALYESPDKAALAAYKASCRPTSKAVYITLNPLTDELVMPDHSAVNDNQITHYRNLLIDFDTHKPEGEDNSSDDEKKACWDMVVEVERTLRRDHRWPKPGVVDSGNGYHLLYKLDLENTAENRVLVSNVLRALAHTFKHLEAAHIDTVVWNPSRITKLAGTWARKGAEKPSRPWRRSDIITLPEQPDVLSLDDLNSIVNLLPQDARESVAVPRDMDPEFDFEAFCRHYDFNVYPGSQDGVFYLSECPGWGKPHAGAPARLILKEGLGFKCHHGSCPASEWSMGDVLRHLHEAGYERYEGPVYLEKEDDDSEWAWEEIAEPDAETEQKPEPAVETRSPDSPLTPEEHAWLKQHVGEDDLAGLGNRARRLLLPADYDHHSSVAVLDDDEAEEDTAEPQMAEEENEESETADDLKFDENALHGELGRIAEELTKSNLPLGWVYPSLLTCAAALPDVWHRAPWPENTNLYCALIGGVSGGKSTVMSAAKRSIGLAEPNVYPGLPVSAPGLINAIGEQGDTKVFVADEFKSLLKLMRLEGSILGELLCTMFYEKSFKYSPVGKELTCSGEPSLLGGLAVKTEEDFAELFGKDSNSGFLDRLIFGYTDTALDFEGFELYPKPKTKPCGCVVPKSAYKITNDWGKSLLCSDVWNRAGNLARRIALIQSSFNGEPEISQNSLDHAMAFCEWQLKIRRKFRSSRSEEDKPAKCYERLQRKIMKVYQDQKSGKVVFPRAPQPSQVCDDPKIAHRLIHWPTMAQSCGAYRFGASLVNQTKKAMLDDGSIGKWDPKTQKESIAVKTPVWVLVKSLRDV